MASRAAVAVGLWFLEGRSRVGSGRVTAGSRHAVVTRLAPYRPAAHDPIVALCRRAVSASDLHYLAYHVNRACVFQLDVLEDPALGRFFEMLTPDERRAHYATYGGRGLPQLVASLNADLKVIDSGSLIRLVLDVERGALYYFAIHRESDRYLLGATLDQDMVHVADARLAELADEIRHHIGHPHLSEPGRS